MNEATKTNTTSAHNPLPMPNQLDMMDRSAFALAFHEEMQRADPEELVSALVERAMARVQAFLENRQTRSKMPPGRA